MYPYLFILGKPIPAYGICSAVAILSATIWAILRAKKYKICQEDVIIIAAAAIGGCFLGAKLLYIVVTYSFQEILQWIQLRNFLFISNSGFVFYGGLLFGIVGAFVGAKIAGIKLYTLEGAAVPTIPFGHAIGRIGCLLAGCCYGVEYEGIGSIHYNNSLYGLSPDIGYFPVQIVEAGLDICISIYLLYCSQRTYKRYDLLVKYLILYAVVRFITEFMRGDFIRGGFWCFSTAQWFSIFLLVAAIAKIVLQNAFQKRI